MSVADALPIPAAGRNRTNKQVSSIDTDRTKDVNQENANTQPVSPWRNHAVHLTLITVRKFLSFLLTKLLSLIGTRFNSIAPPT